MFSPLIMTKAGYLLVVSLTSNMAMSKSSEDAPLGIGLASPGWRYPLILGAAVFLI